MAQIGGGNYNRLLAIYVFLRRKRNRESSTTLWRLLNNSSRFLCKDKQESYAGRAAFFAANEGVT
jgi:hypothetical protein